METAEVDDCYYCCEFHFVVADIDKTQVTKVRYEYLSFSFEKL